MKKKVPFLVSRGDGRSLVAQVTDGLREAIVGGCDFTHLDVAFSRSVDLVVAMYHRPEIYANLANRKIPYVVFGEKAAKPASAVGAIHFDYNMANSDFAAAYKKYARTV